jgi:hypothetical protein
LRSVQIVGYAHRHDIPFPGFSSNLLDFTPEKIRYVFDVAAERQRVAPESSG